ncbi:MULTISPECIES: glycerophosphodiester phosphodiesterase [Streptomyces]|uniref:glycerophosphodiester phosphodiesterase n=1 Tax=Streptomyces TaxID=1883 RepID=UPI00067E0F5D|nr:MULTISPECIES: glycerophosphodiester phosphodiesterase family protein [Streptomyces]
MIGHRGTAADENTMRGFRDAQRADASGIELEVWWTRDGMPVVMHDPTVDRTTNGHGAIANLTAAQVSRLRTARSKRVPTLDKALR